MKKFLLFFLSFSVCCSLHSQQAKIDSLQAVINKHSADTTGVETLVALAGEYYLSDPSKAENCCWKANQISQAIHFEKGKAASYGWLAFLFEQRGAIDSALLFYSRALEIDKKVGDKKQQGQLLNNIAAIYKDQGKIDTALVYYARSIALHKAVNDVEGMATTINNIGLIYQNR